MTNERLKELNDTKDRLDKISRLLLWFTHRNQTIAFSVGSEIIYLDNIDSKEQSIRDKFISILSKEMDILQNEFNKM